MSETNQTFLMGMMAESLLTMAIIVTALMIGAL